ncbi:hypothetical protein C7T35_01415 [Variovorax sp. WS11]|uniref:phage adaptor protein n=1 Tax=Variovorax sp. WS11 TaxID=1105204 RepID=UPI000D0D7E65|nr:DUF6682 family protein [Variovorax sp. WS11]NDZ11489.1 hypothetical protein [Variovorax sp. WS11]PSL86653.1 hypothetical protein C7T35_01415 [Variovorax sp. WS11]
MDLEALIGSFRVDADDLEKPQLFADEDLARWFNEAEEEAAIRKRLLFDETTPEVCQIAVQEGVSGYPLHPALFEITAAFLHNAESTCATRLMPTDRVEMDRIRPDWRTDRCTPEFFIQEDTRLYLPCIVRADYTLKLEGYRLPLEQMEDDADTPEIGRPHHRFLVHWVLHRAYSKPDSEIFNPDKAQKALSAFEQYFGLRPDADLRKDEQANRPHRNKAYW